MKKYIIRAAKYMLTLTILFVVVFTLMLVTGTSRVSPEEGFQALCHSSRGMLMVATIIVLALIYPAIGFVKRNVAADIQKDRAPIIKAFEISGFMLESETPDQMVFVASSLFKRVRLMWEDRIVVKSLHGGIEIDGLRKEVVKIEYRMGSYLMSSREE